ncbi:MAG TPA: hypothetical protein VIL09_15270 [Microvirga sp.]
MTLGSVLKRGGGIPLLAALALCIAGPAAAQVEEDDRYLEDPLPLPESRNGVVRPRGGARLDRIDRIDQVYLAVQACWQPQNRSTGQEITLRMSFKRSGEVLGQPRITYYKAGGDPDQREAFTRSVREAFQRCTPLPFTDRFGAATAGRPFTFRFVDTIPL